MRIGKRLLMVIIAMFPIVIVLMAVMTMLFVMLTLMAVMGVSAQLCLIRAYSIAEPSIIGPIEYTGLIWAPIFGYLIWRDVPDGFVASGALIIVASGLYIIHRESGLFRRGVRR